MDETLLNQKLDAIQADLAALRERDGALSASLERLDARVAALEESAGHTDDEGQANLADRVKALESHNGW